MTDSPSETEISSYQRKFRRAQAEIEDAGLIKHVNIESILRHLRAIGFEPRPYHYWESALSYVYLLLFLIVVIAAANVAVMFLLGDKLCIPDIVGPAVLAAVALTTVFILLKWYQRKKYKLSRWGNL